MTVEGPGGRRYLVDRQGVALTDDYDGPAVRHDGQEKVLRADYLDPASRDLVVSLVEAGRAKTLLEARPILAGVDAIEVPVEGLDEIE